MKKTLATLLTLLALLCVCAFSFASCDDEEDKKPTDTDATTETTTHEHLWSDWTTVTPATCAENGSQERTCACGEKDVQVLDATALHTCNEKGVCTVCNKQQPYTLTYVSNGDGTCYVSQITTYDAYQEDFTLEIPEKSPAGDRVTAVRCPDFAKPIPKMLTVADYEELLAALKAKVDAGELIEFYYKKFNAFFQKYTLTNISDKRKEHVLANYPICAVTDIYVYATDTTPKEDQWILSYLQAYCNYTNDQLRTDYQHLHDIVNASSVENKAEILASLPTVPTAFAEHVTAIRVPNNIEEMPLSLYSSCYNLKELTLPACITEITEESFSGFGLTKVSIHSGITTLAPYAFANCEALSVLTISEGLTTLGEGVFEGCVALTNITLPQSLIQIGSNAFSGCSNLTSITISKNVTDLAQNAFEGCSQLASITVESGNTVYHSAGNCLIATESKELLIGCKNSIIPADGSVTSISDKAFYNCDSLTGIVIPHSITSIGSRAFEDCDALTNVVINGSVTSIGTWTFYGCDNLTNIVIPASVTTIEAWAFYGCTALEAIYYTGTEAEWQAISVEGQNTPFTNATYYLYSENPPTTSGNYWHYVNGVPTVGLWEADDSNGNWGQLIPLG